MQTKNLKKGWSRGFSMVEMVLYIVILFGSLTVVASILVGVSKTDRGIKSSRNISTSGTLILERFVREVRNASTIVTGSSVLDANPGSVTLSGTDIDGNPRTVAFFLSSGAVHFSENGVDQGAINPSNTTVTYLRFNRITNTNSDALRIQLGLESGTSTSYKQETFYTTTTLRNHL